VATTESRRRDDDRRTDGNPSAARRRQQHRPASSDLGAEMLDATGADPAAPNTALVEVEHRAVK
jgi:hypothetical protein